MPPRAPGVHTHEEWKGMAQPVGLVVEPVVLNLLGIFPESATTVLADWQQRLEQLLDDQPVGDQAASDKAAGEQWLSVAPSSALAVNLAKLSLWLVTLSKELPFTFVDHALKGQGTRRETGEWLPGLRLELAEIWEG